MLGLIISSELERKENHLSAISSRLFFSGSVKLYRKRLKTTESTRITHSTNHALKDCTPSVKVSSRWVYCLLFIAYTSTSKWATWYMQKPSRFLDDERETRQAGLDGKVTKRRTNSVSPTTPSAVRANQGLLGTKQPHDFYIPLYLAWSKEGYCYFHSWTGHFGCLGWKEALREECKSCQRTQCYDPDQLNMVANRTLRFRRLALF